MARDGGGGGGGGGTRHMFFNAVIYSLQGWVVYARCTRPFALFENNRKKGRLRKKAKSNAFNALLSSA